MAKTPVHSLRVDPDLKRRIDAARGQADFGTWMGSNHRTKNIVR